MHPALHDSPYVFNPLCDVQLQQQPALETIPADSPTDIESNSSLSEDSGELLPCEASAQPSAPRYSEDIWDCTELVFTGGLLTAF